MSLDLGALIGRVILDDTPFETTYVRVVRRFADLGARAEDAATGTSVLDRALAEAAAAATVAADALGTATRAELDQAAAAIKAGEAEATRAAKLTASSAALLREVEATEQAVAASGRQAAATSEAALADSRLAQARLRAGAAQDRLTTLQASGTASARQLAAAEASLAAANDRVALSTERLERATALGARTNDRARSMWASIPGPVKAAVAAVAAVAVVSVDASTHFQDATTRIQTQANASRQQVDALRVGILDMTGAVATAPGTLADAAFHIASVGQKSLTTAQELDILRISAEAAKLGHANLVDVTNALDAAVVAGIHGVSNYSQAMGVLNATVGAGDMKLQDLAEAFGPLAAVLKGYNVTIQQTGAALATFGDNNLRGADAGTALRMSVQALAVPVAAGRKELEAWGFWTGNLTKQLQHGGLTEALDALMKAMRAHGVTAATQGDFLTEAFGKRAGVGINILMGELDRYHTKLDEVTKGGNTFASAWDGYTRTLSFAWGRITAGAEGAAVKIGDRLLPDATRALSWLGTTGVDDVGKLWHALATNSDVTAGMRDIVSAAGDIFDALRNVESTAAPLARVLLTAGGGAALVAFRVLATVLKDVAVVLDDVTGFFARNHAAAEALAFILATALVPAALATGKALLWTGLEATAAGIGKLVTGGATLTATLKSLNMASLAASGSVVFFAVEAYNDIKNLNAVTDKLRMTLSKPLQGNVFATLANDSAQATGSLSTNITKSMSTWKLFETSMRPDKWIPLALGWGDNKVKASQAQIGAALGNIHDLQHALYGLNAAPIDAESKISTVINAMHLSVKDLATKDFPGLVANVQAWIAANQAANTPAAQAAKDILAIGTGAQTAAQDVQSLKDALDQLAGKELSADEAAITFRNDLAQFAAALKTSKGSLSLGTQPGRDARQGLDVAAKAALDLATSLKDAGKSNAVVRASLQASITALKAQAGSSLYAKQAIADLQTALDALPGKASKSAAGVGKAAATVRAAAPQFRVAGKTIGQSLSDGMRVGIEHGSGQVLLVAEQLVGKVFQVMSHKAQRGSPSKVTIGYGRDIADGLPIGFLSRQPQVLAAFKQGTTATLYAVEQAVHGMLSQAQSKLTSDVQARASSAQSITSGIIGNFGLAGAFGPSGNVGNLSAYFGGGASTLHTELALLAKLRNKHLAPGLLAEIAGLAPQQAIAAAQSILSGQSGSLNTLNRDYADIARYAGKIGQTVASAQFDKMIAHDREALVEAKETNAILRELVAEYRKQPKALAAALDSAIRTGGAHR